MILQGYSETLCTPFAIFLGHRGHLPLLLTLKTPIHSPFVSKETMPPLPVALRGPGTSGLMLDAKIEAEEDSEDQAADQDHPSLSLRTLLSNDSVRVPHPPLPHIPVGGRLAHFVTDWMHLPITDWHLSILQEGLRLTFQSPPPLSKYPRPVQLPRNPQKRTALLEEFWKLHEKGAIEPASNADPGFYAHLFTVPKKTGGLRLIIDLKVLNTYIYCPTFKMENDLKIRGQLQVGEWMTSVDLSDAYLHLPIHPLYRKFMRMHIEGKAWQFKAMCFGLNVAPRIFTKMLQPVAAFLRTRGVILHRYLDDWLVRAKSAHQALAHTQLVVDTLTRLGWLVNQSKSELIPSQRAVFLGMDIDLRRGRLYPTPDKLTKIKVWINFLHQARRISVREYLSMLGLLNHTASLVILGRLHLRPLQFYLASFHLDLRSQLETIIPLRPVFFLALQWWGDEGHLSAGIPLHHDPPTQTQAEVGGERQLSRTLLKDSGQKKKLRYTFRC